MSFERDELKALWLWIKWILFWGMRLLYFFLLIFSFQAEEFFGKPKDSRD